MEKKSPTCQTAALVTKRSKTGLLTSSSLGDAVMPVMVLAMLPETGRSPPPLLPSSLLPESPTGRAAHAASQAERHISQPDLVAEPSVCHSTVVLEVTCIFDGPDEPP